MAQKIVTVCDLDGCGREDATLTSLSFDTESVEIDLCPEHKEAVYSALYGLLHAGRPIKRRGRPPKAVGRSDGAEARQRTGRVTATAQGGAVPGRINHAGHEHPMTKRAYAKCRAEMLAAAATTDVGAA